MNTISNHTLEFSYFQSRYLENKFEAIFFTNLESIIKTSNLNKSKISVQKQIERLMNTYQLKKSESKLEINPFWFSKLNLIFKREIAEFSINLPLLLDGVKLKENFHKNIFKDPLFFIPNEVFIVLILSYVESYKKTSKDTLKKNLHQIKHSNYLAGEGGLLINNSTFCNESTENLVKFLEYKFRMKYVENFFKKIKSLSKKKMRKFIKI